MDNRYRMRRAVWTALTLLWMVLIFYMSSQDSDTSASQSAEVGRVICSVVIPGFSEMPEAEKMEHVGRIDFFVRKCAHMTEYAVLGILLAVTLGLYGIRNASLPAWIIAAGYAATDELHQSFSAGRSCEFRDVCIDAFGALAGIAFLALCREISGRYRREREGSPR